MSVQLLLLRGQVALLRPGTPADLAGPLRLKYRMYQIFLVLALASAAMEVGPLSKPLSRPPF